MRRSPLFDTAESVEEAFYDAMRRADLEAMMALWSTRRPASIPAAPA